MGVGLSLTPTAFWGWGRALRMPEPGARSALRGLTQQHERASGEAGVLQVQDHQAAADAQGAGHERGRVVQQGRVSGVQVLQAVCLRGGGDMRGISARPLEGFWGWFFRLGLRLPLFYRGKSHPGHPRCLQATQIRAPGMAYAHPKHGGFR